MNTLASNAQPMVACNILDQQMPVYDVVLTEHTVVGAPLDVAYRAARELDFLTIRAPLVTALMTARSWPSRLRGRPVDAPAALRLATDPGVLPGWLSLGETSGHELAFGAIGKFWKADIEWLDVPLAQFAAFAEPGWGKIACHLLVREDGPDRTVLSYECRTGTTDLVSRTRMRQYWWLIRPFVGYILRATLRTIRENAEASTAVQISPASAGG